MVNNKPIFRAPVGAGPFFVREMMSNVAFDNDLLLEDLLWRWCDRFWAASIWTKEVQASNTTMNSYFPSGLFLSLHSFLFLQTIFILLTWQRRNKPVRISQMNIWMITNGLVATIDNFMHCWCKFVAVVNRFECNYFRFWIYLWEKVHFNRKIQNKWLILSKLLQVH